MFSFPRSGSIIHSAVGLLARWHVGRTAPHTVRASFVRESVRWLVGTQTSQITFISQDGADKRSRSGPRDVRLWLSHDGNLCSRPQGQRDSRNQSESCFEISRCALNVMVLRRLEQHSWSSMSCHPYRGLPLPSFVEHFDGAVKLDLLRRRQDLASRTLPPCAQESLSSSPDT